MRKASFKICVLLFSSLLLFGHIYFWVDENGIKHFSNITLPLDETVEQLSESHVVSAKLLSKENKNQIFKVLTVYDGDTIKVAGLDLIFKIRLVGIDSPEIGYGGEESQPFSQAAKQYLSDLLENRTVSIKSYGIGMYNRQLAEVSVDGKNINLEMVKAGLAEVYTGDRPKNLDSQAYLKEEARVRKSRKGMWQQGRFYKSPRQWRKEHPRK